jgi:hypothetical protein
MYVASAMVKRSSGPMRMLKALGSNLFGAPQAACASPAPMMSAMALRIAPMAAPAPAAPAFGGFACSMAPGSSGFPQVQAQRASPEQEFADAEPAQEAASSEPAPEEGSGGREARDEEMAEAAEPAFAPKEAVRQLNLLRSSEGCWELTEQVLALLARPLPGGERPAAQERLRGSCPEGLSAQQWASVLVLAFLRKHCGGERALWEGMERKALEWLQAGWPQGPQQGLRSPAATVIGAGKLL